MTHAEDLLIDGSWIEISVPRESHDECTGEKDSNNTDGKQRRIHLCRDFWFKFPSA